MADRYVTSTTPGMTWACSVHRGSRGIVASAIEGKLDRDEAGRIRGFSFMMFQDRTYSIPVSDKRLTDKVKTKLMNELVAKLRSENLAEAD